MKLKREEAVFPSILCGEFEHCLEHGFNCDDCPHIPDDKREYDPYSGAKIKK